MRALFFLLPWENSFGLTLSQWARNYYYYPAKKILTKKPTNKRSDMNRMFLKSSLPLSQTVVKAVKNGLSKDNLFMLSHQTLRRKHGTSNAEAECALIGAAKKAKLSDKEIVSLIMTGGISLGQINYAILKSNQQMSSFKSEKANKTKSAKISTAQQKVNERISLVRKLDKQKIIKFSAPLKVVTANAQSFC
jgi:hypothetical protein